MIPGFGILTLLLAAFLVAGILAIGLCRAVMGLGVVDAPDGLRKMQAAPVPTSGGVGFAAAAALAAAAAAGLGFPVALEAVVVATGGVLALLLGFSDDRFNLRARWKLILMIALSLAMVALGVRAEMLVPWPETVWALPLWAGAAGSILWLVVVMNAVNFMDGANGLSMGMSAIASLGLCIAGVISGVWDAALLAGALAGALCGFMVWNVPGRLFAGDAGALFTGAILAGVSLLLVKARPDWVWLPPLLLLPFLTDVLLTLVWRAKHGKALFAAHRDHVYQIALKAGLKHWQVAAIHGVASANCLAVAVIAAITSGYVPALGFLGMLAASVWVHLRVRRSGVRAGLVGADIA